MHSRVHILHRIDLPASVVVCLSTIEIVFVLLVKATILKQPLPPSSFVGVAIVFVSSILIGMAPLLGEGMVGTVSELGSAIGVVLTIAGAIINAIFFAYLEMVLHPSKLEDKEKDLQDGNNVDGDSEPKMSPLFIAGGIGIFSTIANVALLVSVDACALGLGTFHLLLLFAAYIQCQMCRVYTTTYGSCVAERSRTHQD